MNERMDAGKAETVSCMNKRATGACLVMHAVAAMSSSICTAEQVHKIRVDFFRSQPEYKSAVSLFNEQIASCPYQPESDEDWTIPLKDANNPAISKGVYCQLVSDFRAAGHNAGLKIEEATGNVMLVVAFDCRN